MSLQSPTEQRYKLIFTVPNGPPLEACKAAVFAKGQYYSRVSVRRCLEAPEMKNSLRFLLLTELQELAHTQGENTHSFVSKPQDGVNSCLVRLQTRILARRVKSRLSMKPV